MRLYWGHEQGGGGGQGGRGTLGGGKPAHSGACVQMCTVQCQDTVSFAAAKGSWDFTAGMWKEVSGQDGAGRKGDSSKESGDMSSGVTRPLATQSSTCV